MYQKKFAHNISHNSSVCVEEKNKEYCRLCPLYVNTMEERMDFVNQIAESYGMKKAWFSDQIHFFCYDSHYALEVMVNNGYWVQFFCDDDELLKRARKELAAIIYGFLRGCNFFCVYGGKILLVKSRYVQYCVEF